MSDYFLGIPFWVIRCLTAFFGVRFILGAPCIEAQQSTLIRVSISLIRNSSPRRIRMHHLPHQTLGTASRSILKLGLILLSNRGTVRLRRGVSGLLHNNQVSTEAITNTTSKG
jgi:hypothetical protein